MEADGSFMYVHGNPESKAGIIAMAEATQELKCLTFDYTLEVTRDVKKCSFYIY